MVRNNYALACSSRNSFVGIYVQVLTKRKPTWQLLVYCLNFNEAKRKLHAFDENVHRCKTLRKHYADGSSNWALFYTNYGSEPAINGRQLGKVHRFQQGMQMEEIEWKK